jgi:GNAT superfamily N-acetyltransferase
MEVHLREAQQADLPVLRALEQALVRDERPFDPTIRPDPVYYHDLPALLADPESRVLLAEADGKVVACGFGTRRQPRHYLDHDAYAYLGLMYTLPEYRGQGINGRIIADLKRWAVSRGLTEIRLTVYYDNEPALRAYEKAGFKRHLVEMRLREGEGDA